jgi:hypothetical protein
MKFMPLAARIPSQLWLVLATLIGGTFLLSVGEAHLRRILQAYARYYNDLRTHRSLDKDVPFSRPVQRIGSIASQPLLGGLHHHYMRV